MNGRELDQLLQDAKLPHDLDSRLIGEIADTIASSTRPVRPLAAPWLLGARLVLACAVVALAGAAALRFLGIAKMNVPQRAAVFSVLSILTFVSARELVSAAIPGSRRRVASGALVAGTGVYLAAVLLLCFRDFQTTRFLHSGLVCLGIGTAHALVAGLLAWIVLRGGFAVDARSAGLAGGTLAGLAGVSMLELHCPNFETAHVLVWHVGVVLVSAGLGAFLGRRSALRSAKLIRIGKKG